MTLTSTELRAQVARWMVRIDAAHARYGEPPGREIQSRIVFADPRVEVWFSRWPAGATARLERGPRAFGVMHGLLTIERWRNRELWSIRNLGGGRIAHVDLGEIANPGPGDAWVIHAMPAGAPRVVPSLALTA
jgi:hypothetical protein